MKKYDLYIVKFENSSVYMMYDAIEDYEEAKKVFNRYKNNKKYASHRAKADAIVMYAWNYDDEDVTEVNRFNLK